jgi:hypothetical protein
MSAIFKASTSFQTVLPLCAIRQVPAVSNNGFKIIQKYHLNSHISPFNFMRMYLLKFPLYERLEGLKIYRGIVEAKLFEWYFKFFGPHCE